MATKSKTVTIEIPVSSARAAERGMWTGEVIAAADQNTRVFVSSAAIAFTETRKKQAVQRDAILAHVRARYQ